MFFELNFYDVLKNFDVIDLKNRNNTSVTKNETSKICDNTVTILPYQKSSENIQKPQQIKNLKKIFCNKKMN